MSNQLIKILAMKGILERILRDRQQGRNSFIFIFHQFNFEMKMFYKSLKFNIFYPNHLNSYTMVYGYMKLGN